MKSQVVKIGEDDFDVYIGRGGKWGNPFSHKNRALATYKVSSRKESIEKHREWIKTQPDLIRDLHELKGKVLGCFCKPKKCHGDTLVEMVNELNQPDIF